MNESQFAIWGYGSHFRGDADCSSDVDILVVSDSQIGDPVVAEHCRFEQYAASRYTWSEIEGLAAYGSLFLHHVRLEGKCLFESPRACGRLSDLLINLVPYKRAGMDVLSFRQALADITTSIGEGGSVPFELSNLGTLIRHACILGCYLAGTPTFGRHTPVARFVGLRRIDTEIAAEFPQLYEYRIWSERGADFPGMPERKYAERWCRRADLILGTLEGAANEHKYARTMPSTARAC